MFAILTALVTVVALADEPKTKVEFRRAETKAAEGLTEAKVNDTDEKVYLHKTAELTNEDIALAKIGKDGTGGITIEFEFTKEGAKKLAKFTADHKDKPLAIQVDGKVIAAPIIKDTIRDKAVITGKFANDDLEKIVKAIKGK